MINTPPQAGPSSSAGVASLASPCLFLPALSLRNPVRRAMLQGRPAASLEHGLHLASAKEYRRVLCKGTSGLWLERLLR